MPALLLYLIVAVLTLILWNRWVAPVSRRAALLLLLFAFPFAGRALLTNRVYGGYDLLFLSAPFSDYAAEFGFRGPHNGMLVDQVLQFAPWQHEFRRSIAQREWPLWNPTMNAGDIFAANMQSAPYSPLNWLAMLIPIDVATAFDAAMVFFLAALFTYAYAREIGCSEESSLIAAAGFTLCTGMARFVAWPHGRSWAVLPLVMLAVRRVVHKRDAASFFLLTIAFVLLISFGHPETMLHVVTIGVVYGVFELIPVWREWRRAVPIAFAAGGVALLLMSIFLLPFLAVLRYTWEYAVARASFQGPAPPSDLWRLVRVTFLPYYGEISPEFGLARVGSVILALALLGGARLWRRREVRFLIALCVVTLLAGANAPPIATVLRELPLFDIAKNGRLSLAAAWSLSLLAAFAFDSTRRDRLIAIALGVVMAIAAALFWRRLIDQGFDPQVLATGAAVELIGLIVLIVAFSTSSRRVSLTLILVAIAAQRVAEAGRIYPTLPREMFYPRVPLVEAIPRNPLYRVVATGNLLMPNAASMYGLEDVRGYAAMTYVPYVETMTLWCPTANRTYHDVTDLSRPFLSFLGVRHAITPRTMEPPPGWRVIADDRGSRLMENERAIPRVFVPRRIRFVDNHQTSLEQMAQANDFADEAWIFTQDMPPQESDNGEAVVKPRRIASRYEIDVDAKSAARIVISEVAWPGWRAYVDDRRVKIAPANRAFLSVYVPEGKHHVRVVYLPDAFVRGRAVSFATAALLAIAIGVAGRDGRRLRPGRPLS